MIPLKYSRYYLPFYICLFLVFIVMFYVGEHLRLRERKDFILVTRELGFSGIVVSIKKNRSASDVTMKDGSKFFIDSAENQNNIPSNLNEFMVCGDSLYKPNSSDTIFIIRGNAKFLFVFNTPSLD